MTFRARRLCLRHWFTGFINKWSWLIVPLLGAVIILLGMIYAVLAVAFFKGNG